MSFYVYLFIGSICLWTETTGLRCMSCLNVRNVTDCMKTEITCQDGKERCFLDKHSFPDESESFSAGCRPLMICALLSGFGRRDLNVRLREKKALVSCAKCCDDNPGDTVAVPCNGFLCNQNVTYPTPTCAICNQVSDPALCRNFGTCPTDEVCHQSTFSANGTLFYHFGCQRTKWCDSDLTRFKETGQLSPAKRDLTKLCSACCDGKNCNLSGCPTLLKSIHRQRMSICPLCKDPE